jgi:2-dehydro-3-deoxyphosphogluconate aldolase / (4S)-4-hydroxy-2-oxoglutarate aldolase
MNTTHPSRQAISSMLMDPGVIAVIRGQAGLQVAPLCEALIGGGITAIEITMTTPDALSVIRHARREASGRALIGVGTVLDVSTCKAALDAGAQFVVTPITRTELITHCHAAGKPVMVGAYTPTEAQTAWEEGADFIKIFPADTLGPDYIKGVLAPLPHLRCVPTGGIDLKNISAFIKAGCVAVGVGSSLVSARMLKEARWADVRHNAAEFVRAVQSARSELRSI